MYCQYNKTNYFVLRICHNMKKTMKNTYNENTNGSHQMKLKWEDWKQRGTGAYCFRFITSEIAVALKPN